MEPKALLQINYKNYTSNEQEHLANHFLFNKNIDNTLEGSPSISFNNITFYFEDEEIVTNFSFEAKAGQHTLLKGESGSGKSTLLKLLLGFHKPVNGTISINNKIQNAQRIRKQTAWLPQDLNLGTGTVAEIMAKPFEFAANQSLQNKRGQKIQDKTLKRLGLNADILDKQFRDLSTGQRQRVGLAICHLLDKPLLLLDEPTSALDEESKEKAAQLLLNSGHTVLSTSHDPSWVTKADHIIELS